VVARYVAGIVFDEEDWQSGGPDEITVFEIDRTPVDTGLVDAMERPIYRVRDTVPMGFHHRHAKGRVRRKRRS
jgi:hypothetical protein